MLELKPSKYLPYFIENKESLSQEIELIGDILLIERIVFPEKKVGSLFIADSKKIMSTGFTSETPNFYRVLMVGRGFFDPETGKDIPVDITQGAVIYTGAASVKVWSSVPGLEVTDSDIIGVTRHGDVQMAFKSEQLFLDFLNNFNKRVQEIGKEGAPPVV